MNRWAHKPITKTLALAAAFALAIAPVDLLALCGCAVCGCAAAADDAPGCCCTGQSHARGCCGTAKNCSTESQSPSSCCQPEATPAPDGCTCSKAVPDSPIGTLPDSGIAQAQQAVAIPLAPAPPITAADPSLSLAYSQDQPLWPVPVRILLCVWRN
jgi:hypothetical protein